MSDRLAGLVKILGISLLLIGLWGFLAWRVPESFLATGNIENLLRRTALYGILGIGVAFVIIGSGIDLSIGSLVCLAACLLALFLRVDYVELDSQPVWQVNASDNTLLVSANHGYHVDDYLWYDKDRRNRGLLRVVDLPQSNDDAASQVRLTVSEGLSRDQISDDQQPVAKVTRTYPLHAITEDTVTLAGGAGELPGLRPGDRLVFVHPQMARRERTVADVFRSTERKTVEIRLTENLSGVEGDFQVLPVVRKPLMSIPLALVSVMGVCLFIGLIHGLLVTRLNLQPFIVTLCGLMIYRGLSRWLTADQTVGFSEYTETLARAGTGRWVVWQGAGDASFGIPYSFLIFTVVILLAMVLLNLTVWGRHLMAVGRNPEAARYSGINHRQVLLTTYVVCAFLAGIGGMMSAIDSMSISPTAFGNFYELYAIAAAVLGGCSLRGGEGSILGVVVGTALMQTLYNAIILLQIPDTLQFAIVGGVILVGVTLDELLHRARNRRRPRS